MVYPPSAVFFPFFKSDEAADGYTSLVAGLFLEFPHQIPRPVNHLSRFTEESTPFKSDRHSSWATLPRSQVVLMAVFGGAKSLEVCSN